MSQKGQSRNSPTCSLLSHLPASPHLPQQQALHCPRGKVCLAKLLVIFFTFVGFREAYVLLSPGYSRVGIALPLHPWSIPPLPSHKSALLSSYPASLNPMSILQFLCTKTQKFIFYIFLYFSYSLISSYYNLSDL